MTGPLFAVVLYACACGAPSPALPMAPVGGAGTSGTGGGGAVFMEAGRSGSGGSTAQVPAAGGASGAPAPGGQGGSEAGRDGAGGSSGSEAPPFESPQVTVATGVLEGKLDGDTRVFIGIPYAVPPVGALRFAPPKPAAPWSGVRPAIERTAACVQLAMPISLRTQQPMVESEDCLTLDAYAPAEPPAAGAPVMVFIHGGGGNTGTGSDYDGRYLSAAGDVVVVTLNYRLGTLAWFVHGDLDAEAGTTSGNLGLRDQQLALAWVQQNIAAFGGDPGNVTLFGESHGASAVCMHMFAKGSETLAHRYIMESGGCVGSAVMPGTREGMDKLSTEMAAMLCPERADAVPCMRSLDAKKLATWRSAATMMGDVSLENQQGPYIDGELIPALPRDLLRDGRYRHAPILVGSNLRETYFLESEFFRSQNKWPLVNNGLELTIGLLAMYPQDFGAILEHYGTPATDADANRVLVEVMDDAWMKCPGRALARGAAAHGDPVYVYSFDLSPAVHTLELDYVFGDPSAPFSKLFSGAPVPPDPALVALVQGYWLRFARTGDPNGAGAPAWPRYDLASDPHLVLNTSTAPGTALDKADCDFWQTTYAGGR